MYHLEHGKKRSRANDSTQPRDGLLLQEGRLKQRNASSAKDVIGFKYLIYSNENGHCYKYYAANPPLVGTTRPKKVTCPVGLHIIYHHNIDYKEAIHIFHSGNWGDSFTSITLSKPVYKGVTEPYWEFTTNLGVHVVIGANSGKIMSRR